MKFPPISKVYLEVEDDRNREFGALLEASGVFLAGVLYIVAAFKFLSTVKGSFLLSLKRCLSSQAGAQSPRKTDTQISIGCF